jgi:hypothetical protein
MDALKLRLGDVVATKHSRYCWLYNPHAEAWMFHKVDAKEGEALWFTLADIMKLECAIVSNVLTTDASPNENSKYIPPLLNSPCTAFGKQGFNASSLLSSLGLEPKDLGVLILDNMYYTKLSGDEFEAFTGLSKEHRGVPDMLPRKIYYDVDCYCNKHYFDWRSFPIVKSETREGYIDESYGRPIQRVREAQAVWYPNGYVFWFDGFVYKPTQSTLDAENETNVETSGLQ